MVDGLTIIFVASGAGFFLFVWPLHSAFLGVTLEYFTLFHRVPGDMNQACFFTGRPIARMACKIFLALARAALLGVGRRDVFCSLTFTTMTGTFGICSIGGFRSCFSFLDLF